ncbi:CHC2 zinc finger domain-containing protein [Chengkuizengella sediminis]|uniref:CHC2 zinc finger domain-containing protein n=1 Tax=Chengkuizengella sediminis TaxID=1885917 RepID=UPI001F10B520|nr:CHC2 zinc finger domain-containing protein [Chengkuizengella sediminis]
MSNFLPDIKEIAEENGLLLRKARNQYKALCLFHSEKSPSLYIHPEKNIFKCFGCGEGGGVIKFKAKLENKSEQEIFEELKSQNKKSYKASRYLHPAERLTSFQFKAMSEVIPDLCNMKGKPNWDFIRKFGNEEYLYFRSKVWRHWLEFLDYEKKDAEMTLRFGIRGNSVNEAIKEIKKREKLLGVTIFNQSMIKKTELMVEAIG